MTGKADEHNVIEAVNWNIIDESFSGFFGDEPAVQKYINHVKFKQRMPFFGIGVNPVNVPLSNWENCFFNANSLECKNKTIYWSLCPC